MSFEKCGTTHSSITRTLRTQWTVLYEISQNIDSIILDWTTDGIS